jgi:hypothetical protein
VCRIETDDKAVRRVAKRHCLDPEQRAEFPGLVALDGLQANPVGCGWARNWYLKAKRIKRIPAPQIEVTGRSLKRAHFIKAQAGKLTDETATAFVTGLGIRPKGHPHRARLIGTIDDDFINGKSWLPPDFDFAVWNAAWPDQQSHHLQGDETIELVNLCAPNAHGVRYDREGNTVLRLSLPRHDCFALLRFYNGTMIEQPLVIDTLIVEPETQTLSLVWRATFDKDPVQPLRVVEARMRTFTARDKLNAAVNALQQLSSQAVSA